MRALRRGKGKGKGRGKGIGKGIGKGRGIALDSSAMNFISSTCAFNMFISLELRNAVSSSMGDKKSKHEQCVAEMRLRSEMRRGGSAVSESMMVLPSQLDDKSCVKEREEIGMITDSKNCYVL